MSRPWMAFYPADYLADTSHLSRDEHGGYMLLIMHYWTTGGLPDDDARLARIARATPAEWQELRRVLRPFFSNGWRHKRIDQEMAEATVKYEKRAEAGRKGGLTKASNASFLLEQNPSNALPTTTTTTEERKKESIEAAPSAQPAEKRRRASSKVPFPEDWTPKEGVQPGDIAEFERFKDSARANARVYADWEAAWRNWCTSPYRRSNGSFQTQHRQTVSDAVAELRSRLVPRAGGSDVIRPAAFQLQQPDRGNSDVGGNPAGLPARSGRGGDITKDWPPDAA